MKQPTGPTALIDSAVVLVGLLAASLHGVSNPLDSAVLQFAIALVLVNLLDVVLPHGDSVDMDSALVIASIYLLGPATTLVLTVLARTMAHVLSGGMRRVGGLVSGLAKRSAGLVAAGPLWLLMQPIIVDGLIHEYIGLIAVGLVFVLVEVAYGQLDMALSRSDSIVRLTMSNLVLQGPLLASSVSVAILTVLVYEDMTIWGLALMGFLILAIRQSFALLLDVRNAYHATVEALIGAMEAQRPGEQGTGEKLAVLARRAGAELGWFGSRVENLGYAALLYYFGLGFREAYTPEGGRRLAPLSEVKFFKPVEPIVRLLEGDAAESASDSDVAAAYLVGLAVATVEHDRGSETIGALRSRIDERTAVKLEQAVARAMEKATQS